MSKVGVTSRIMMCVGYLGLTALAMGQDQPPKAPAAPAATTPEGKEFQALFAEREALSEKLQSLKQEIDAAGKAKDEKKFNELVAQFRKLITDFQEKKTPRLTALGVALYTKDAKNEQAEDVVLGHFQDLFHDNKYKQIIAEGTKLMMAGRNHPLILNFVGVSHFAVQDFGKAESILKMAQAAGEKDQRAERAFQGIGSRYLGECQPYAEMWKKELAIREKEAAAKGDARLPRVEFKTTKGDIELELFENEAPNTVANFISLVDKKFYDGIAFHRVIENFMAQGGDPNTKDNDPRNDGQGGPGYHIACECYKANARMHFQGSLSMAHAGRDTGGSQFFLTHLPTGHLNPDVDNNRGHTVFGRIVKGLDVALSLKPMDRIISAKVLFKRNHAYTPVTMKGD